MTHVYEPFFVGFSSGDDRCPACGDRGEGGEMCSIACVERAEAAQREVERILRQASR